VIVVEPELGLGNRLRVISSFMALAQRVGRPFALSWAPSRGWSDEDLDDLFENSIARVTPADFEDLCADGLRLHEVVELEMLSDEWTCRWVDGVSFPDVFDQEKYPIITYRGFQSLRQLVPPPLLDELFPSFRADYVREARGWRPVSALQQSIDRVVEGFGEHTVGVHIRRGDAWKSRRAPEYQRSSDAAFMAALDRELESDPDVRFFLATDSLSTENHFRERYGSALLTNTEKEFVPSLVGRPKDNQRDAVVDMFALARTRRILGNYLSSFCKFSALVGGIEREDVLDSSDPDAVSLLRMNRSGRSPDTVASFAVNGVGLGHASRLVAVHGELRREGALESTFFVRHEMELIADYGFQQTLLPRYEWYLMELGGANESRDPAHELAQVIVEMTLRGKQPIILHDVFIHRAVYEVAVDAGWPQAMIYRHRLGVDGPAKWLRTVAPAVSVAFVIGQPGYEERDGDLHIVGVEDVLRTPLGERSLWKELSADEVRIVVTGGGGGHGGCEAFLNAAIAAVDIVSHRTERRVRARIVTGPYFRGETRFPTSSRAQITLSRYIPPTRSLYADATVVVAQAGYNTVHELNSLAIPYVLVPLNSRVGYDDQGGRAEAFRGRTGVYVARCSPFDIAAGIEAAMASPKLVRPESGERRPQGAFQIATVLEALAGV
jgi:Glycosyltransferase family 28 C-terminal domain